MANALVQNTVVCAEPGDCCQPGTVTLNLDGVALEFCLRHALARNPLVELTQ